MLGGTFSSLLATCQMTSALMEKKRGQRQVVLNEGFAGCLRSDVSQNRMASKIHPSALVPTPSPKPCPRPLYSRYSTFVPDLRRASTLRLHRGRRSDPVLLTHHDERGRLDGRVIRMPGVRHHDG